MARIVRAARVMLVVFAGLPGVGKSVLSRLTADSLGATYLRVDAIDSAIAENLAPVMNNPVSYALAANIARDQLRGGRTVVVDAVNAVEVARQSWVDLAAATAAELRFVEVTCSDPANHRRRLASRGADLPGVPVVTWADVSTRRYDAWQQERLVVDNDGAPSEHVATIVDWLAS